MQKSEFTALPLSVALGLLFDAVPQLSLAIAPQPAQAPRFDGRCRTKGGLVYASECDLSQLQYYHARATKPPSDEKYRERQEKEAKALTYWIKWRSENPDAVWRGERNRVQVTAAPPSSRPAVSQWDDTGAASAPPAQSSDPDYGADDQLPF